MSVLYDVVVIGGGPAGSVLAARVAREGRRVALFERERFPRFHLGESLAPGSVRVLRALGVADRLEARYLPKRGVRFVCCRTGRQQTFDYADAVDPAGGVAWQVPRADFDEQLLRHATSLGAEVHEGTTVEDVRFEGDRAVGVRVRDERGVRAHVGARLIVDASGRDSLLASRVRVKHALPGLDKTALFAHFQNVPRPQGATEGHLDVVVFPHGWCWNAPLPGAVSSIGAVCSATWVRNRASGEPLERFFQRTVDDAPILARALSQASRLTPVQALAGFAFGVDRLAGPGWLLVGDAAGFLDPLFCSGVHLAIAGAWEAAGTVLEALARNDLSERRLAPHEQRLQAAHELLLGLLQGFYTGDLGDALFDSPKKPLRQSLSSLLSGDLLGEDPPWRAALRARWPARSPG